MRIPDERKLTRAKVTFHKHSEHSASPCRDDTCVHHDALQGWDFTGSCITTQHAVSS